MGELAQLLLLSFIGTSIFLGIVFIIGHTLKRYDLIDGAWGPAFIVITIVCLVRTPDPHWSAWLVSGLVAIWGLRLSIHILQRFFRSSQEDPRYVELRQHWPQRFIALQTFFRIYLAQALLACLVASPVMLIIASEHNTPWLIWYGVVIWLVGFLCESIADQQLKQFLRKPSSKGQLMTTGLWRYSRHPNYFGELTQWWGIGIIACGTSYSALGLLGPLIITLLIIFVSGIPLAEKRAATKQGWRVYKQKTRVLLPLPK